MMVAGLSWSLDAVAMSLCLDAAALVVALVVVEVSLVVVVVVVRTTLSLSVSKRIRNVAPNSFLTDSSLLSMLLALWREMPPSSSLNQTWTTRTCSIGSYIFQSYYS